VKKNISPTTKERLAEALRDREECSKTCMALIAGFEGLIVRFKRALLNSESVPDETNAEIAVSAERALIRKARRGR
jgi:hypothetical protein